MNTLGTKKSALLLSTLGMLWLASGYASASECAHHQTARIVVEDTEDGVALVLTPSEPEQLDALRANVRSRTEGLASSGQCLLLVGPSEKWTAQVPAYVSTEEDPFAPWKFGG